MNRLRNVRISAARPLQRKMSHWFQKNIYIEENAGMREKSPETFQLTATNCFEFFCFIVLPGYFIYDIGIKELVSMYFSFAAAVKYGGNGKF